MTELRLNTDLKAAGSTTRAVWLQDKRVKLSGSGSGIWVGSSLRSVDDKLKLDIEVRGLAGTTWAIEVVSEEKRTLPDGTKEPVVEIEEKGQLTTAVGKFSKTYDIKP
jgi:hypothetical protein